MLTEEIQNGTKNKSTDTKERNQSTQKKKIQQYFATIHLYHIYLTLDKGKSISDSLQSGQMKVFIYTTIYLRERKTHNTI